MATEGNNGVNLSDDVERYIRDRVEAEVVDLVPKIVAKEEDRRFGQLKWVVAFVGVVGLGTFGTLSNYLIEKAVDSKLESKTGNMTDALDFIRFNSLSQKLESNSSFSREDRAAIMSYLRKFAKNERVRYSPDFIASLTQVLEAFTRSGQDSSIDEIIQTYEKELLNTDTVVEILLHHYGQRLVARAVEPKDDHAMRAFEKLEAVSAGAKVQELALVYRSLFLYKKGSDKEDLVILNLFGRVATLEPSDRNRYFREILLRTKASNWQTSKNDAGVAFERITRGFLKTYANHIAKSASVEADWILRLAQDGVAEGEAKVDAQRIGARYKVAK